MGTGTGTNIEQVPVQVRVLVPRIGTSTVQVPGAPVPLLYGYWYSAGTRSTVSITIQVQVPLLVGTFNGIGTERILLGGFQYRWIPVLLPIWYRTRQVQLTIIRYAIGTLSCARNAPNTEQLVVMVLWVRYQCSNSMGIVWYDTGTGTVSVLSCYSTGTGMVTVHIINGYWYKHLHRYQY